MNYKVRYLKNKLSKKISKAIGKILPWAKWFTIAILILLGSFLITCGGYRLIKWCEQSEVAALNCGLIAFSLFVAGVIGFIILVIRDSGKGGCDW